MCTRGDIQCHFTLLTCSKPKRESCMPQHCHNVARQHFFVNSVLQSACKTWTRAFRVLLTLLRAGVEHEVRRDNSALYLHWLQDSLAWFCLFAVLCCCFLWFRLLLEIWQIKCMGDSWSSLWTLAKDHKRALPWHAGGSGWGCFWHLRFLWLAMH